MATRADGDTDGHLLRPRLIAAVALLGLLTTPAPGQIGFGANNLAVLRVNGTGASSGSAQSVTLFEIRDNGGSASVVQSFTLATPSAANTTPGITLSNAGTTAGHLHRSADGLSLSTIGYSATVGTGAVSGTSSATASRVVADISLSTGAASYYRFNDTTFSGGEARAAVGVGGNKFYVAGNTTTPATRGVRYADFGAVNPTGSTQLTSTSETRDANVFGPASSQRLFAATNTAITVIGPGAAPPTGGTPTIQNVVTGLTNIRGFYLLDRDVARSYDGTGLDTVYVVAGSGVRRYDLLADDTSWALNLAYDPGVIGGNLFGLTARVNGASVDVFVTEESDGGNLIKFTDPYAFNTASGTVSAGALDMWSLGGSAFGSGYNLRGIELTPVPEPVTVLGVAVCGLGLGRLARRRRRDGLPPAGGGVRIGA